jgi:hypothetical protein
VRAGAIVRAQRAVAVGPRPLKLDVRRHNSQPWEITMGRKYLIANAVLWAAAIIASALVAAPTVLSLVVLPALASISLLLTSRGLRPS